MGDLGARNNPIGARLSCPRHAPKFPSCTVAASRLGQRSATTSRWEDSARSRQIQRKRASIPVIRTLALFTERGPYGRRSGFRRSHHAARDSGGPTGLNRPFSSTYTSAKVFATFATPLGESNPLTWIDVPSKPDYGEQRSGQIEEQHHPGGTGMRGSQHRAGGHWFALTNQSEIRLQQGNGVPRFLALQRVVGNRLHNVCRC